MDNIVQFVKDNYLLYSDKEIAKMLPNVNRWQISRIRRKYKLFIPLDIKEQRRIGGMIGRTTATEYEDQYIKDNYLILTMGEIEKTLNRSSSFVAKRMKVLGITIPKEILNSRKTSSFFAKGNVSFNKGKRQVEYMSREAIEKTKATRFKKGNISHNANAEGDGAITIRKDKSGRAYKYIRLSLGKWELLHRILWQQTFGEIPDGNIVVFKDGNSMNCNIANLEMITLEENMMRNTLHQYPSELKDLIKLNNKLKKTIHEQSRKADTSIN